MLQKYMVAVDEFIKSKSGTEEVETDHGLRFVKKKSRKELRKEKRKLKKAKMKSHYEGKKNLHLPPDDGKKSAAPADEQQQRKKVENAKKEMSKARSGKPSSGPVDKPNDSKTVSTRKNKKTNKLKESRKMALLEANEDEDREIKKLERYLGLNKRKNKKSLPQSFVADGLDYILGMLDSGSSAVGVYDDDDDMDMAKENFEKLGDKDEPEDEMASEGSDEASVDDENELDEEEEEEGEDDDDDDVCDEEEEDDGVVYEEEMEDELNESDAVDSENEREVDTEREADAPDTKTSGSKSESVSQEFDIYVLLF